MRHFKGIIMSIYTSKLTILCHTELPSALTISLCLYYKHIGYEPADLTVHPPPPRTAEGRFIFFV